MKETYSGKLGVRPDHPRLRSDMWSVIRVEWSTGGSYKFQVLSKSVEPFSRCGGHLPFPVADNDVQQKKQQTESLL